MAANLMLLLALLGPPMGDGRRAEATLSVTGQFVAQVALLDTECGCVKGSGEGVALAMFIPVPEEDAEQLLARLTDWRTWWTS